MKILSTVIYWYCILLFVAWATVSLIMWVDEGGGGVVRFSPSAIYNYIPYDYGYHLYPPLDWVHANDANALFNILLWPLKVLILTFIVVLRRKQAA
ncbi:MAG: hypothetical protein CMO78_05020 [Verrucomicrobiales bacterium]|nr:hypothetical protein [Verrucomicrobiales bacterium]